MPNKNHSKSDKKTRKYKQRCAQLLAEAAQLKKETEKLNKECAEQSKKTDKKFEEVNEQLDRVGKKIEEVSELQRVNSEELTKTVEGLRQVRIAAEKNGDEVKDVVEGLRQDRIAAEKRVTEVKEVVEGLRQVRIASEKAVIASEKVRIASENHGDRIGHIGNNLGSYTEAMAMPSIRGILERDFDAEFKGSNLVRNTNNGLDMEVDAWGVSRNGTGAVYVVEIKRKFHDDYIKQIWQTVKRFRVNKPEYRAWAVYPMLAVVDISKEGRAMVWNAGIHLIEINDGVFRYAKPPQDFEADGYHGMRGVRKDVPHLRAVPG